MEEVKKLEFLPDMAQCVGEWFPNLKGRAVAVTDAKITPENRPTLPFALVALNRQNTDNFNAEADRGDKKIVDDFIIEFWLPVQRFTTPGDKPTQEKPFWAYYPFEDIRDRLISKIMRESKKPERKTWGISYTSMDIDADPQAVVLTFRFSRTYIWCPLDDDEDDETPIVLSFTSCPAVC